MIGELERIIICYDHSGGIINTFKLNSITTDAINIISSIFIFNFTNIMITGTIIYISIKSKM
ncbi:hypothetical protein [Brevibacillus sp. NRS-1366]|uniref:hypothetical protein n=1 Tax=Brevibacillus sp. NRS-1366 TaxID=3233899 RepID=UPI003D230262